MKHRTPPKSWVCDAWTRVAGVELAAHDIRGLLATTHETNTQRVIYGDQRGYARTALEYANNQRDALKRFFEDGKLVLSE